MIRNGWWTSMKSIAVAGVHWTILPHLVKKKKKKNKICNLPVSGIKDNTRHSMHIKWFYE